MAVTPRLTDEETEALRAVAKCEGKSTNEVARTAIRRYTHLDVEWRDRVIDEIATRDAELLDRLAQ